MLATKTNDKNAVTFCELVEHPGGHDGGEFPQYHTYEVADDGSVCYSTNYPECVVDAFDELDKRDFFACETREEALVLLQRELKDTKLTVERLEKLVDKFKTPVEFTVYFADEEVDEEDEDD